MRKSYFSKLNRFFSVLFALTLLFSLFSFKAVAAESSGSVLPVEFKYSGDIEKDTEFTVVIESVDGAPLPNPSRKTVKLKKGQQNAGIEFEFIVPSVGVYNYKLHQVVGDDKSIDYDDTVYDIALIYENASIGEGAFRSTFVVSIENSDSKPETVIFSNANFREETTTGTPEEKTPGKKGETPNTGGETNQWNYLAWMISTSFSIFCCIAIYVIYKNEEKKTDSTSG